MKTIIVFLCAALLLTACAGGNQNTAEPIETAPAETTAPEIAEEIVDLPEPERVPVDLDDFAGFYDDGSYDFVTIEKTEDGYAMTVELYRLIALEEGTVSASEDGVVYRAVDAAGNPMTVLFYRYGETYALRVDESTWDPLEAGTVIYNFVPSTGERGDLIDPNDLLDAPHSHYVFQPKVCSVYMEEVFGKDMCDAWLNLVDAVLAGEDTFACKDQHTYDWMMGQFPEHCLPVLPELIDYAWDREHSVVDGVGSFTYRVPPEEAKARIEEFGEMIEGMLNEIFEDDWTDFEKALALYVYFAEHYVYDYETYWEMDDHYVNYTSCYRFFMTGIGICHEISSAYSYLLLQAGMQATTMSGNRAYDQAGHQWSFVRLNGKNYHIDPTYALGSSDDLRYFLMTDEKREEEDCYDPKTFYAVSHYSRENPHPDYTADDETFRTLWDLFFEAFYHKTHIVLGRKSIGDFGEWTYEEFDYTGY
ncbi:MAG: hypothetical protein IKZ44_05225 [Clostridia bacterium]|nr:hypothetical protein [Clostridia bacterium]